ncbi:MAG: phosphoribosylformylglycinamidine synthase subunit PurL [Acidobacteria bacterium]|nr:phosphoribosylformylglycinamidine synthase subunit PurL [Acidobacteriota bacterium]MBU1473529.1 phosphoribosylformylglycinamidine synthase subunit PurL [Acidobacteriota bacterium]
MIDKKILSEHNLTEEEYRRIIELIGKEPNITELGIFSLMWSEHCSYKSSKAHLKKLPVKGEHVIQGPGENAGIIDIGDGLAAVFKIESHNHPSFIEPYQGAATGVGGILRDIFTMGARPIALLDSLRFGPLENAHNRSITDGVVSGIAGYGNAIGVPTVGGETYFHPSYSLNPLVNVFCLGIADKNKIFYAKAEGPGNAVLYVGSKTGRDGIHGATMASAEFDEDSEKKRPNVQVGDPFKEKLLLEACLEIMDQNLIVGIQDMGAAGLTCSTSEMASNSGSGIEIDLDRVPQREEGMTAYEIMLSESQERMLLVASNDKVKDVQDVFAKWDLDAVVIGRVTDGDRLKVRFHGETVVDIPVDSIVNLCPLYLRPSRKPDYATARLDLPEQPEDLNAVLLQMLDQPTIADKEWIYRQYDHMVQTNTVFLPGAGTALLRLKGTESGLAMTLDGNSLYCYLDPRTGGKIAVAEACRNLACVGARPLGVTNCLNFGNPEKPGIMWQFMEVIEGISEACLAFGIPVTGGNVSFYNDTEGVSIHPTPVLGIVGRIEKIDRAVSTCFKSEGDLIFLLGENREELGGSEYLRTVHGTERGLPPIIDLDDEKRVQEFIISVIDEGLVSSAADPSEGGLAVCLAECVFASSREFGFAVELDDEMRTDALLFGETQSRILLSAAPDKKITLLSAAKNAGVPLREIGRVGGTRLDIRHRDRSVIDIPILEALRVWKNSIPERMSTKT